MYYILLFIVDGGLAVWASLGHPLWVHCLNIILVIAASGSFCTSTVQAIKSGRFFLPGHVIGIVLALIGFRLALFIFPIWMLLQLIESVLEARKDHD